MTGTNATEFQRIAKGWELTDRQVSRIACAGKHRGLDAVKASL
jgi:hypothetical protein